MDKRWIWIGLGLITLLIRYITPPELIEQYYSRGIFLGIRSVFDLGFGWFPLPLFYVFYLILIGWGIRELIRTNWRKFKSWRGIQNSLFSLTAFIGGIFFFFFFLWGYNYGRIPLVRQVSLKPQPASIEELRKLLTEITPQVLEARNRLSFSQSDTLAADQLPDKMELKCRQAVVQTLSELGYPTSGRVRGRVLFTKGILLRFGSSGVYWPFVGEGNIDGGLHTLQQPFTLCHELAHGYGIANEGVCNFLAYVATQHSADPYIRYSGLLCYWRYVAIAFQRGAYEEYQALRNDLPKGFIADLDAINHTLDLYPDFFPKLRYAAYDSYLKSQGIAEGMKSYSSIIMLVEAWKKKTAQKN